MRGSSEVKWFERMQGRSCHVGGRFNPSEADVVEMFNR